MGSDWDSRDQVGNDTKHGCGGGGLTFRGMDAERRETGSWRILRNALNIRASIQDTLPPCQNGSLVVTKRTGQTSMKE